MILTIGRESNSMTVDVAIPRSEDTVGRIHAELSILTDGRYYLLDRESVNGTFLFKSGTWEKINNSYVTPDSRVRFGEYETTVSLMLETDNLDKSIPPDEQEDAEAQQEDPRDQDAKQRKTSKPYYDADLGRVIQ